VIPEIPTMAVSTEDKQIQILHLQIRLAELTQGTNRAFPSSYTTQSPLYSEGTSTPSSISTPSQIIQNSYMNDHTLYNDQDQGATLQAGI
jgi:hypothetical protein